MTYEEHNEALKKMRDALKEMALQCIKLDDCDVARVLLEAERELFNVILERGGFDDLDGASELKHE